MNDPDDDIEEDLDRDEEYENDPFYDGFVSVFNHILTF
jgi:hypothetical protein